MRLQTDRLIIRSWTEADVDGYARIVSKPSVMRFIGNGQPEDLATAKAFIVRQMEREREGQPIFWAVENRTTGDLLGFCGFAECNGEADMGWRYDDACWGKGYGSEAAQAVLAYALETHGFKRIISRADPRNTGSIRIMQKLGFAYEKEVASNEIRRAIYSYQRA